ncbi:FMN-dependent NADH-azoreductase [Gimibacter soli]|uniref:FMN dependent NADH:quinone oxidoreductase n=1 Tax=Gimibacter soli TaxID=3024400 RepID=A0AAE9XMS2_9PROT|nr:NAD(P)H-dependent oxidoreductase [Gimibacter soli]WCL52912.1 NAD(P)H-dependent oxidoreductase [Gimibacter soli]
MTNILRIDASARQARSLTRQMSDLFLKSWAETGADMDIIQRDVGSHPPEAISEGWIAAAFTPQEQLSPEQISLLKTSDTFIEELERANIILISTPMYNYGMPAALKAWVDQVVRVGKTFTFDLARGDRPLEPIFSGKTLVVLTASGEFGFGPGEMNDGAGHLVPHLRTVSKYLGTNEMHHIGIEYQEFGDHRFDTSKAAAAQQVERLAMQLAKERRGL